MMPLKRSQLSSNEYKALRAGYYRMRKKVLAYINDSSMPFMFPYIKNKYFEYYIRKIQHPEHGLTIQFANIQLRDKKYTGHGFGTRLIEAVHNSNTRFVRTEVECVGNESLAEWLSNHGWLTCENNRASFPSFYKVK